MDEKSLIKKYQKEISSLREELQQLKRGMMLDSVMNVLPQEDLINLKLQVHACSEIVYKLHAAHFYGYFMPSFGNIHPKWAPNP